MKIGVNIHLLDDLTLVNFPGGIKDPETARKVAEAVSEKTGKPVKFVRTIPKPYKFFVVEIKEEITEE